nr:hypothetical protein GCM10020093_090090 [Planobispora longispora]
MITVKGFSYTDGKFYGDAMPEGKKWVRARAGLASRATRPSSWSTPRTRHAEGGARAHRGQASRRDVGRRPDRRPLGNDHPGRAVQGLPTVRALLGAKPSATSAVLPVKWQLYIGSDRLVRRAVSSWTQSLRGLTSIDLTYLNDSRYSGWGVKSAIEAPPADQVAEVGELDFEGGNEDPFARLMTTEN